MKRIDPAAGEAAPKAKAKKAPAKKRGAKFDASIHLWPNIDMSGGPSACHPWKPGAPSNHSYGRIWGVEGIPLAHRKAFETIHGRKLRPGEKVLHACHNPLCCNGGPGHMYSGDQKQNVADAIARGTHAKRKLTPEKAIEIAALKGKGLKANAVALHYGVAPQTIDRIWLGLRWAGVTGLGKDQPKPAATNRNRKSRVKEERAAL